MNLMSLSLALAAGLLAASAYPTQNGFCPPAPEGSYSSVTETDYGPRKSAKYVCNDDYIWASGQFSIPCEDGQWNTQDALVCKPNNTPHPATTETLTHPPTYAPTTVPSTYPPTYQSTDTYPTGSNCPPAPIGRYSSVSVTGYGSSMWALYECDDDLVWASGQSSITCDNGKWNTQDALVCKPNTTPHPHTTGAPTHSPTYAPSTTTQPPTYPPSTYAPTTRYPGTTCPPAPTGSYSSVTVGGYGSSRWALYDCEGDYIWASGQFNIACVDGKWNTQDALVCKPNTTPHPATTEKPTHPPTYAPSTTTQPPTYPPSTYAPTTRYPGTTCPPAPIGSYSSVTVGGYGSSRWAQYECEGGYIWASGLFYIACVDGKWNTQDAFVCKPNNTPLPPTYAPSTYAPTTRYPGTTCPPAPIGSYSSVTAGGYGSSRWALYECEGDYIWASGQFNIACDDGKWNTQDALVCKPNNTPHPATTETPTHPPTYAPSTTTQPPTYPPSTYAPTTRYPGTTCPPAPIGRYSSVTVGGYRSSRWAQYDCEGDYIWASGQFNIACDDGKWNTQDALVCKPNNTPHPATTETATHPPTYAATTQPPTYPPSTYPPTTRYPGTACPPAPTGSHSSVTESGPRSSRWAQYACDGDFIWASGQHNIVCVNGVWATQDALACKPNHY